MENAYTRSTKEALSHFQVTEAAGLSAQGVESSRAKYGRNGTHPTHPYAFKGYVE
jgi:Ca2+ transporting ATPase